MPVIFRRPNQKHDCGRRVEMSAAAENFDLDKMRKLFGNSFIVYDAITWPRGVKSYASSDGADGAKRSRYKNDISGRDSWLNIA